MGRERRPCVGLAKRHKAGAQRHHAARRCLERFGIRLTERLHGQIVGLITGGKAEKLSEESRGVRLYRVRLPDGAYARVAYDHERHTLVTFLPDNEEVCPQAPR